MVKRIFAIWVVSEFLFVSSLFLFEHEPIKAFAVASYSIQWLLFILCVMVIRYEPIKKNRYVFLNFALFFLVSLLFHVYNFVGKSLFSEYHFAKMYFTQYVSYGTYFLLLAFALGYLCFDALFRDFKVSYKYLLTLFVVGGFFLYYYHGYITNPRYLHSTGEAHTWKTLDESFNKYIKKFGEEPSPSVLAQVSELKVWKDDHPIGNLYPEERARVVAEYYPYLFGTNYMVLLYRPLYMNTIYMCVLCVGFILLFFGYQYMKDPPQGAYIDKIMFLFLIFCTMEILHAWSCVKSVEWQSFYELLNIGQAVSICILALIVVFFGLRLKFIRSVKGEFYEQEILSSPGTITRWRDALDDLLVAHFFNRKAILGRLFVSSSEKS